MEKKTKTIPLNKIVVENIDPFKPVNQVVETKIIQMNNLDQITYASGHGIAATHWKVQLMYHYKRDCMLVKVDGCKKDGTKVRKESDIEFKGARPSFIRMVAILESGKPVLVGDCE